MRYSDLLESNNTETLIGRIKGSKWYKESDFDFYRGIPTNKGESFTIFVDKNRDRRPTDSKQEIHDYTNELSLKRHNINLRNGLFLTQSINAALDYGKVYIVYPMDGVELYYNPKVRDFYADIARYTAFNKDKPNNNKIEDYIEGIKVLEPNIETCNEIMGFGEFIIVSLDFAEEHGLFKDEEIMTYNMWIKKSIELLKEKNTVDKNVLKEIFQLQDYIIGGHTAETNELALEFIKQLQYIGDKINIVRVWEYIIEIYDSLPVKKLTNDIRLIASVSAVLDGVVHSDLIEDLDLIELLNAVKYLGLEPYDIPSSGARSIVSAARRYPHDLSDIDKDLYEILKQLSHKYKLNLTD